jgi:hypothetical protein
MRGRRDSNSRMYIIVYYKNTSSVLVYYKNTSSVLVYYKNTSSVLVYYKNTYSVLVYYKNTSSVLVYYKNTSSVLVYYKNTSSVLVYYKNTYSVLPPPIYEHCWCLSIVKTKSSTKLKITIIKKIFIINKNTIGIFISDSYWRGMEAV